MIWTDRGYQNENGYENSTRLRDDASCELPGTNLFSKGSFWCLTRIAAPVKDIDEIQTKQHQTSELSTFYLPILQQVLTEGSCFLDLHSAGSPFVGDSLEKI